jgi:hypothetical protein
VGLLHGKVDALAAQLSVVMEKLDGLGGASGEPRPVR